MTRKVRRMFGAILGALCVVAAGFGIALLIAAHGMPAHVDEQRAEHLTQLYEEHYVSGTDEQRQPLEREIISLRTSKWRLYQAGLVFCLVSPLLLFTWLRFGLWDVRNLKKAETPRSRLALLGLAGGAWLALLPAIQLSIHDDFAQDDLTPHIDTGNGTFLIFGTPLFLLILVIMLKFGHSFILSDASLPANLWCWDSSRPNRSLIVTLAYALLMMLIVLMIAWSVAGLAWALPSLMIGLYVILSSRAAAINRVAPPTPAVTAYPLHSNDVSLPNPTQR